MSYLPFAPRWNRALSGTLKLLLALVVLAGVLLPASPALAATCTQYHTVQRGETLYSIGVKYGVSWRTLAEWNSLANPSKIFAGSKLCVSQSGTTPTPAPKPPAKIPTFSIVSVARDTSVTIRTANFPANDTFNVLMGAMGTRGVNGTKVGTYASGTGASQDVSFNIPAGLKGSARIAIRLESPTSGYFSYNWFYNNSTSGGSTGGGQVPGGYRGYPTFSIAAVVRDTSVTIAAKNLPPNDKFEVRMGAMGTRGVGGTVVTTIESGTGGDKSFTITGIPAALKGSKQIAIRIQSPTSGYFAYNWFYNNSTP